MARDRNGTPSERSAYSDEDDDAPKCNSREASESAQKQREISLVETEEGRRTGKSDRSRRKSHGSSGSDEDDQGKHRKRERSRRRSRRRHSSDSGTGSSSSTDSESESDSEYSDSETGESGSESEGERRRRKRKERRRKEEERERKRRRREKEKKRRRREREEEEERRRKKKKKHKKKRKDEERAERGKTGAVTNSWGKYGVIRETDMWNKRPEFTAWLAEVKQVNLEHLANWEEKQMFKQFMEDHNTATFPSKKYYNLDAYHNREMEKQMKKGLKKIRQEERTVFNDEEQRRQEMMQVRERQKEEEINALKRSMQSGMAQDMKEQARLREEMAYQYKLGNFEAAAAIQRRLDPNIAM